MAISHRSEGTVGLLTYLLASGAVAVNLLLGILLVGSGPVSDQITSPILGQWIESGDALNASALAFLVFLPFLVIGVSGMMGRRAAISGNPVRGAAAVNALLGVLLSWTLFSVGLLITGELGGGRGVNFWYGAWLAVEGYVYVLIALLPLMGVAALTAGFVKDAFDPGVYSHELLQGGAPMAPPSAMEADVLDDVPIDCPDCSTRFLAAGMRPLRIACPTCGKTGTIR